MFKKLIYILSLNIVVCCTACGNASNLSNVSKETLHEQIKNARTVKTYSQGTQVEEMDSIKFGHKNGESIEWLVIDKSNDVATLISKYVLASHVYVKGTSYTPYEDSEVRRWLNSELVNDIFTKDEQKLIDLRWLDTEIYFTSEPTEYLIIPSKGMLEYFFSNCPNSFRKATDVPYGTPLPYMLSDKVDNQWLAAIGDDGEDDKLPLYVGGSEGYPWRVRPIMNLKY